MDLKPRITHLFTILITFTLLLSFMPFIDSAFSAAEEKSLYLIHVSSFKNQKAAETETSRFLEQGLQAFYRKEAVEGKGDWFRVFIGTFKNRQEAMAKGVELMQEGIITYAAPREVTPDFIPGRKTAEVEINAEERNKPPAIEEEPPPAEIPQKQVEKPIEKVERKAEVPVRPPVVEEEPPPVEAPQEPVSKPIEKAVQESPAPEEQTVIDRGKKVEYKPKGESSSEKPKFSIALNGGVYISSNTEDFKVTEQTPSTTTNYFFNGDAYQISLESSMRAYEDLNIYGRVEYVFVDDVDILFVSLGPKLRLNLSGSVFPYIKGGVVWGDFSFDTIPGKFDDGFGYEGGFGLEILKTPYKFGLGLLYRGIEFDYIPPGIDGVTANDSSIDASGFSISGTFTYYF